MADVPYDVWHSITTFLPSQEVKNLYSLNHSLYNLAMDERYKKIFIGSLSDGRSKRAIKRLVDPGISSRVREFTFKPGPLCKLLLESASVHSEKTSDDSVSNLVNAFGSMNMKTRPSEEFLNSALHDDLPLPAHWTIRNVLQIMKQLTSLTSLQVEIRGGQEHWHFQSLSLAPDLLSAGWSVFNNTLTSLTLKVPLEDISKILPPAGILPIKNLENLSFQIQRASVSTNALATTLETLLPFINQHQATLRALTLDMTEPFDISSFLQNIQHLNRLQYLALKQPFIAISQDPTAYAGLQHLLQVHRFQLIDFSLCIMPSFSYYANPFSFFNQQCFRVALPKLRHLSINFQSFPSAIAEDLIPYIHLFKETLVSLDVSEQRWSFERLNSFLEGYPADSHLRDLKISISLLEPQVFKVLAQRFHRLDTLNINFHAFGPDGYADSPVNTIPRFAEAINQTDFSKWDLRKLDLSPIINLDKTLKLRCKTTMINAFPRVESFCGLPPMEYSHEL